MSESLQDGIEVARVSKVTAGGGGERVKWLQRVGGVKFMKQKKPKINSVG